MTSNDRQDASAYLFANRPAVRGWVLTQQHCDEVVKRFGVACQRRAAWIRCGEETMTSAIVSADRTYLRPVGVPIWVWWILGKLLIELLIKWWMNKQEQNDVR